MNSRHRILAALAAVVFTLTVDSQAAPPRKQGAPADGYANRADVREFIHDLAREHGFSRKTLAHWFADARYQPKIVAAMQRPFVEPPKWYEYAPQFLTPQRIAEGVAFFKAHEAALARAEEQYGVPAEIIVAIWGLETNYGVLGGKMSIVRSLATLAYDCRRSAFFRNELVAVLKIVQRGDMTPGQLRGGWAGEIGQTQFLPSAYYKYAVDFDGDGRRDLIRSVPDMLASTANYLRGYGWQAGQSWQPGTTNYGVIQQWNKAQVYVKTIAVMANKMSRSSATVSRN